MRKAIKIAFSLFISLFSFWIIFLNGKLYYQPEFTTDVKFEINTDLLNHLRFLKTKIHNGAASEMQNNYPEGFVFMNALYALSWCEIAKEVSYPHPLYKEAHAEIQFAYSEINSDKGKRNFEKYLSVPYGIFYAGWNNYLLGKKLSVERTNMRDSGECAQFNSQSIQIVDAIKSIRTPFPESHPNASWPSDVMVAVASLEFGKENGHLIYEIEIRNWINRIKTKLDTNGLIPHSVSYWDGKPEKFAEGNSQSLILNFLFEIDPDFARKQFEIYKSKFLTSRFGLPAIRQYPDGVNGSGDVDSGPVIFGIGGAASIVGIRTMNIFGEDKTAIGLRNNVEAFGCSSTSNGMKKYVFGKLPIADAFIAWANSAEFQKSKALSTTGNWSWKFQLYSSLIFVLLIFIFMKTWGIKLKDLKRKQKVS